MLVLFLLFLPIFFFANWAVKRGASFTLRPIAGYEALKGLLGKSAEAGQPVHLSMGTSGIGDQATADTMAALNVLDYLAERGAISASPPIVTCAHPTALPVAQDLLRRAYRRQGYPEEFDPARVRMIAPDPQLYLGGQNAAFAYAAGTMRLLDHQKLIANVMVGRFGAEFLLLGETGARKNLIQIGGTSDTAVLPFVNATMTHPLIGEEIYAGGAYLSSKSAHLGSLLAQDVMRWLLVAGLVAGILFRTVGLF
jgi:hypothetical protein